MVKARDANKVGVIGIASQNMMEEYLQKLELAQEADLTSGHDVSAFDQKRPSLKFLERARNGKGVIANKDFMQVLFITCFLPFIHPNLPPLRESEAKMAKKNEKKVVKLFEDVYHFDPDEYVPFDYEQFALCKESYKEAMERL